MQLECLILKNHIINGNNCQEDLEGVQPGIWLWLIRHFIGLLPVQIFPNFHHFSWKELASRCHLSLAHKLSILNRSILDDDIQRDVNLLPSANVIFLNKFFRFLRRYCVRPYSKRIDKQYIQLLVKYFTASLFLRPFRPGFKTCEEKHFYPLLLYLIVKWPKIFRSLPGVSSFDFESESSTLRCYERSRKLQDKNKNNKFIQVNLPHHETIEETNKEETHHASRPTLILDHSNNICCCTYGSHYYEKLQDQTGVPGYNLQTVQVQQEKAELNVDYDDGEKSLNSDSDVDSCKPFIKSDRDSDSDHETIPPGVELLNEQNEKSHHHIKDDTYSRIFSSSTPVVEANEMINNKLPGKSSRYQYNRKNNCFNKVLHSMKYQLEKGNKSVDNNIIQETKPSISKVRMIKRITSKFQIFGNLQDTVYLKPGSWILFNKLGYRRIACKCDNCESVQ